MYFGSGSGSAGKHGIILFFLSFTDQEYKVFDMRDHALQFQFSFLFKTQCR